MKQTELIMGMPIAIEIRDSIDTTPAFADAFDRFRQIDQRFSPFKPESELSRLNRGELTEAESSAEMRMILQRCRDMERLTDGYFFLEHRGKLDPTGLVKGWAIAEAAKVLADHDITTYLIDAGGDIYCRSDKQPWRIGIKFPPNPAKVAKTVELTTGAIATSGTYERGQHIFRPDGTPADELLSATVIGPDIILADVFATAVFAMGRQGLKWLTRQPGYEGYIMVDRSSSLATPGFAFLSRN